MTIYQCKECGELLDKEQEDTEAPVIAYMSPGRISKLHCEDCYADAVSYIEDEEDYQLWTQVVIPTRKTIEKLKETTK